VQEVWSKKKKTSTPLADGYVEGGNLIALKPECTSQAGFQTCFEVHHYATLVQHTLLKKIRDVPHTLEPHPSEKALRLNIVMTCHDS
jgi:hypothetical protein